MLSTVGSFGHDPLQLGKAGKAVLQGQVGRALDERQHIVHKLAGDAVARLVDPLAGDLLLGVGGQGQVLGDHLAGIVAVYVRVTPEGHHLVRHAVDRGLDRRTAGGEGLVDVRGGGEVGGAALQQ